MSYWPCRDIWRDTFATVILRTDTTVYRVKCGQRVFRRYVIVGHRIMATSLWNGNSQPPTIRQSCFQHSTRTQWILDELCRFLTVQISSLVFNESKRTKNSCLLQPRLSLIGGQLVIPSRRDTQSHLFSYPLRHAI